MTLCNVIDFLICAPTILVKPYVSITRVGPLIFASSFLPDGTETSQFTCRRSLVVQSTERKNPEK
jgi:hypothetical protein